MAEMWINIAVAGLTGIGLVLALLAGRAWFRFGRVRLGLVFFAFLGFLAQGALLTWGLFGRNQVADLLLPVVMISGASLILVYFAVLGRSAAA